MTVDGIRNWLLILLAHGLIPSIGLHRAAAARRSLFSKCEQFHSNWRNIVGMSRIIKYSLVDEAYDRIRGDIAHVHLLAVFLDRRMMLHHQPADVREEEAAISVMRIRASVRESVMRSMNADPLGWMSLRDAKDYLRIAFFRSEKPLKDRVAASFTAPRQTRLAVPVQALEFRSD